MRQLPAAVLGLMALTGAAVAQAAAPLSEVSACRLDAELVALRFSYQAGSACERMGDAGVEHAQGGTAIVTVPVVSTADVCTTQVTNVTYSEAVPAEEGVDALDVRLVSPNGDIRAEGHTDIAPASSDCAPPKPR